MLLNVHHPWAFTYVNLGLGGDNTTVFNISLVQGFNQTGNGTFCFPIVTLPASLSVAEGTNASIQVIQISETGSSLYNVSQLDDTHTHLIKPPFLFKTWKIWQADDVNDSES